MKTFIEIVKSIVYGFLTIITGLIILSVGNKFIMFLTGTKNGKVFSLIVTFLFISWLVGVLIKQILWFNEEE